MSEGSPLRSKRFHGTLTVTAALALLLSGCSSAPPRNAAATGSDESPATAAAQAAPSTTAPAGKSRGGAYYKDDGPHDTVPDNLDAIPDAEPRPEPLHRFANRPYVVFGQEYVPATRLAPFRERGTGSWYGRRFHGNPTSSGEPYDMYAMTAAHPTLPIPSYARVTNQLNGRSVVVRINDRGPFHKGRIIDLSYAAAHRLGYVNRGSAPVEVEAILPGEVRLVAAPKAVPPLPGRKPTPLAAPVVSAPAPEADPIARLADAAPAEPAPGATGNVFLQLGVFSSAANAEGFRGVVMAELASLADRLTLLEDGQRFRLHLGPFASVEEARGHAERITDVLKIRPFVVMR